MDISDTFIKMCDKAEEIQGNLYEPMGDNVIREIHPRLMVGDYVATWTEDWYIVDENTKKKRIISKVDILEYRNGDLYIGDPYFSKDKKIWLPRQDQLQAMIGDKRVELQITVKEFCDFIHSPKCYVWNEMIGKYLPRFHSMEQLWLAFVMNEKYGKVWSTSKEEWVDLK